ncbi:MAG: peptidylprolyl isomerase [bacterium]
MLKKVVVILLISVVFCYCSGSYSPPFKKEGQIHSFFKKMSDSLDIKVLDPDNSVKLITTNSFSIYNGDIMPDLYQQFSNFLNSLSSLKQRKDYIINIIKAFAEQKAENRILLQKAKEKDVTVSEDSVIARKEALYKDYGDKETYLALIDSLGLSEEYVMKNIREGLRMQAFIDQYILTEGLVLDQELRQYYSRDKAATVRHILFLTQEKSESERMEIIEKAQRVLGMARSGYDFAELVEKYSEDPGSNTKGGLYENIERGDMVRPFEQAAFNLPVGEVSDIVETRYGYHIIKVLERSKEERPLEEVKDELIEEILQQKQGNVLFITLNYLKNECGYQEHFDLLE